MGSKARISKYILPIILKYRKENQYWVEPFVGGANMIDKVDGDRIGADFSKYVIEALIDIRDNLENLPKNNKEFTESDYKSLRSKGHQYKGYAGFAFSYSGKWMAGWRRDKEQKRDYVAESYKNAVKQNPYLQDVDLVCRDFKSLHVPPNSLIYCDPPYEGTTSYKDKFPHTEFWQWCRNKHKEGHTIFVSEYNAPEDFTCIWSKEINSSLTKDTGSKKGVEKLFTLTN